MGAGFGTPGRAGTRHPWRSAATRRPAPAVSSPRPLEVPIDGDASRVVRPYLVVCERQAREQAARLFAYDGGCSVYAAYAA
ncbi:hypothetical protein GCM10010361_05100 [Streptomyces olivaceiscleroticus]|uniref:Uncharacterized protein n=1 Tax=Streptomyces olivaceiscleroticus TaxID=68245 RepID=A0ABP3J6W5_9ACTN